MLVLTSHAQNSSFKLISLILLGGVEFWKASLKRILSFGFGLQVQSGDVFGFWASRLTVGVSGIEGSS